MSGVVVTITTFSNKIKPAALTQSDHGTQCRHDSFELVTATRARQSRNRGSETLGVCRVPANDGLLSPSWGVGSSRTCLWFPSNTGFQLVSGITSFKGSLPTASKLTTTASRCFWATAALGVEIDGPEIAPLGLPRRPSESTVLRVGPQFAAGQFRIQWSSEGPEKHGRT
jgi:hypothetical protein